MRLGGGPGRGQRPVGCCRPGVRRRGGRPEEIGHDRISYDDPWLGRIAASRWLRTLWDCSPVDLDDEARRAAAAGRSELAAAR